MINYKIYDDDKYMNWIGDYTYGSITIRGISINIQPKCGHIFNIHNYEIDNDSNIFIDKNTVKFTDNWMFMSELRYYNIDEFLNNQNTYIVENKITLLKELVDNYKIIPYNFIDKYNMAKVILYDKDNYIAFINNYDEFIKELNKVLQITKINNVFAEWI